MDQNSECEVCCKQFVRREQAKGSVVWCPHCGARQVAPAERMQLRDIVQRLAGGIDRSRMILAA